MSKSNNTTVISGTQIKLNIHIDPLRGLHMESYDFECKFYIFPKRAIVLKKEDLVPVDQDNYLALIDTSDMGIGQLHLTLTAYIPDEDFETTRKEVVCVNTGINIINC